ncbi:hypothetical protein [Anaeromyxobacter sp. SG17]|uniref:hypothetical protein n=1 Tax=Anaeromyxobacter sp. SG17 TaxID=2925405 RepID=UPI001F570276|nr:hypothetical protein [Anaeromyxobacter sp. SG17]
MSSRTWKVFAALQMAGVACYLGSPWVLCCGPQIFFSGVALLLPGSPVGLFVVEKLLPELFSPSKLAGAIGEVSVAVIVNALLWLGAARWARRVRHGRLRVGPRRRQG